MPNGLDPIPLAMIVCDAIHVDPSTGKRALLGLFTTIFSTEFPVKVPAMAVYATITECRGAFAVALQVIDANEEREPVARVEAEATSDSPLATLEIDFNLVGLEFPEPGEYRVQLFAAEAYLCERRLLVLQSPSREAPHE